MTLILAVNSRSVDVCSALGEIFRTLLMSVVDDADQGEISELADLVGSFVNRLRTAGLCPVIKCVTGRSRVAVCRRARVRVTFNNTYVGRMKRRVVTSCSYIFNDGNNSLFAALTNIKSSAQ